MKILVIDDGQRSLAPLAAALKVGFARTELVTGGEAGLARAAAEEFDLILVASRPDGISGIEICRQLKVGSDHFLPVVLAAHAETAEIRADGLERGADDYLVLPIGDRELLARVKALLRIKCLHDRVRQLSAVREPVDLKLAADTAAAGLRATIVARGIRLEVRAEPDTPPAWGDREKLTQVLANLLDNAVKFTPEGGRIRVEIGTDTNRRGGAQVHIVVADQGPGIARSDLERIFYPFEQIGAPGGETQQGTGLGLALCRETVESHGGRIFVESRPGAGAHFHVVLPAAVPVRGAV